MPYNYSAARRRYLPSESVKVLFVGESAPAPRANEIRFFYHPILRADNLFRGLMLALYGADKHALVSIPKTQWLNRFQSDGYYLDDLCPGPVNHLLRSAERSQARRAGVKSLLKRIHALAPQGIIICHQPTYDDIADLLRAKRLPVLHAKAIPFPLGNHRTRFVKAVRAALA